MEFLIVVDMQNDFISGVLGSKDAVEILPLVVQKIVEFHGQIIYTRDSHFTDYLETREGRMLPVQHCIYTTHGWELHSCIPIKPDDVMLDKNAFGSQELAGKIEQLAGDEPIEKITLIGLCTDICVVSNALVLRNAFPQVDICVDAKCCAGSSPANHLAALTTMASCQVVII